MGRASNCCQTENIGFYEQLLLLCGFSIIADMERKNVQNYLTQCIESYHTKVGKNLVLLYPHEVWHHRFVAGNIQGHGKD